MGFRRAQWHSGLTYRQTCDECNTVVEYMDDKLDFRPWFADGFVYCPKCKKPLRHRESYAINQAPEAAPVVLSSNLGQAVPASAPAPVQNGAPAAAPVNYGFCSQCGKAFREGDRFCSGCGAPKK
ncbi:MAG: zinc ribbon domain-containing protein [Clostridia bacterium]|nr:zinc ribbon domain-containing protein [Clostridia bacterium]